MSIVIRTQEKICKLWMIHTKKFLVTASKSHNQSSPAKQKEDTWSRTVLQNQKWFSKQLRNRNENKIKISKGKIKLSIIIVQNDLKHKWEARLIPPPPPPPKKNCSFFEGLTGKKKKIGLNYEISIIVEVSRFLVLGKLLKIIVLVKSKNSTMK